MKCHFSEYTHSYSISKENTETPIWYNIINYRTGGVYMVEDIEIYKINDLIKRVLKINDDIYEN